MANFDLLDRLLEHDAWTTRYILDLVAHCPDKDLDHEFDIGHHSIRSTLHHMISNTETWTALMGEFPVKKPLSDKQSIRELRQRFEAATHDFAHLARRLRDNDQLNKLYWDTLDQPPQQKSFGGTILHVVTHDHMHRSELLHMLQHLGFKDLIEGDLLSWEAGQNSQPGNVLDEESL